MAQRAKSSSTATFCCSSREEEEESFLLVMELPLSGNTSHAQSTVNCPEDVSDDVEVDDEATEGQGELLVDGDGFGDCCDSFSVFVK